MTYSPQVRRQRLSLALVGSLGLHAGLAWLVGPVLSGGGEVDCQLDSAAEPTAATPTEVELTSATTARSRTQHADPIAPQTIAGLADAWSPDRANPLPGVELELPSVHAAARGGGSVGGALVFTGRNDGATLESRPWNDPERTLAPRQRSGQTARSVAAHASRVDPSLDEAVADLDREARDRRSAASPRSSPLPDDADPRWDEGGTGSPLASSARPGASEARDEAPGAVRRHEARPRVARGDLAVDLAARGPVADDVAVHLASRARELGPFELTAPASGGGAGRGVAGAKPGDGLARRAPDEAVGDGATRAALARRDGGRASTRAPLQHDYLRRLEERVLGLVDYPPELALRLEQGQVGVAFTLLADGRVDDVRLTRGSGFDRFDHEVLDAVRRAAPFGPVPSALNLGRARLPVSTHFAFDNPLIR